MGGREGELTEIITAGGGAGMMEALVCHPLGMFPLSRPVPQDEACIMLKKKLVVWLTQNGRHHQGAHAALATRQATRRPEARLHQDGRRDCEERDAPGPVQR